MASATSGAGRVVLAALVGGLVSGTADLAYAIIAYGFVGAPPIAILQSIASGWLGKAAYASTATPAVVGVLSHFFITCVAAGCYVAASRRFPLLVQRPLLSGAAFGLGIFVVMNYIVVPLSAAVSTSPRGVFLVLGLLAHVFLVGMPIALFTRSLAYPVGSARRDIAPRRASPQ
jgi:uncharacterized membrane protein YagU involved in acid resistance